MFFRPFFLKEVNEVNTYMVGCEKTGEMFLIDAGGDTLEYDHFLKDSNAKLCGIFLTHHHWDHDEALDLILSRFNVPVYSFTGKTTNGQVVQEGDSIPLGDLNNRIFCTTGHTPNSLTLVVENHIAFVGDALFAGSIGGTSNEQLKEEEKQNIQNKIFTLPEQTLICPGHGPMSTVGIEKNGNPFFTD